MQAAELEDGKREIRRVTITPESAPRWAALGRELAWLEREWRARWDQGD
ncbi:MAG: hypothetical protein HZA53_16555 [Planctomycetes bacterium]|nr:hypothetical protein [Planctomycetota bacterium]